MRTAYEFLCNAHARLLAPRSLEVVAARSNHPIEHLSLILGELLHKTIKEIYCCHDLPLTLILPPCFLHREHIALFLCTRVHNFPNDDRMIA